MTNIPADLARLDASLGPRDVRVRMRRVPRFAAGHHGGGDPRLRQHPEPPSDARV
ncbi:hypothetical protein QNM97_13905 [Gordonia sp. L191]|uniref:hypothetical protein n=1 Tax=Gordonia sp. L191 TaxID=2982699 RepID=UPI0024BF7D8A|nr:hypothetical protein [Gordonia sp. L191]WHU45146.1 hypothetical protein QNM97_13905 [Gordonia sp. L191]